MCGIVGLVAKNESGKSWMKFLSSATGQLKRRGPDAQKYFEEENTAFGHCRLSIIDLSESANQPMMNDELVIIYNGEIFNFKELRKSLEQDGVVFKTTSDTEVLLHLYRKHKASMLDLLNGFFSFAIYDRKQKTCFIARDRFGVKPLVYFEDDNVLIFASEIKALLQFPIRREIDNEALYEYLQLNYLPGSSTIYNQIKKLLPGHFILADRQQSREQVWYEPGRKMNSLQQVNNYNEAKKTLFDLLDSAVQLRLISDVPLGSFLSGGIDSSIISGLASQHTQHLKTFSIGYSEENFFDETHYAKLVAKHFNCDHTVFSLTRKDLHEALDDALNYFDEPFGDSSALPVFILSKLTRTHVKVALSGDGADELFGGYLKHVAEFRSRNPGLTERAAALLSPLLRVLPKSRSTAWGNRSRQLQRFYSGMKMNLRDRYWRWCSIADEKQAADILKGKFSAEKFQQRKEYLTRFAGVSGDLNNVLLNDVNLVLPYDMLMKVDSMSMANGLEVRTPFLDYRIAEFAFTLPSSFKVDRLHRKKIVHDAFKDFLPPELYHRKKRGFEIPLQSFLTKELKSKVDENLSHAFILEQNIFNANAVNELKQQLFSSSPGDGAARVWALLVFQQWWKQWMN